MIYPFDKIKITFNREQDNNSLFIPYILTKQHCIKRYEQYFSKGFHKRDNQLISTPTFLKFALVKILSLISFRMMFDSRNKIQFPNVI